MRVPLLPVLIALAIGLLADCYIYRRMRAAGVGRIWCWIYVIVAIVATLGILTVTVAPKRSTDDSGLSMLMWTLFGYMSVYLPKYIYTLCSLLRELLARVFHRNFRGLAIGGGAVGVALFCLMWWGALFNRYHLDVNEVTVDIDGLPAQFDGYRIAQISDIHTGTWGQDTTFLQKAVDRVNSLHPDVILFTGDIVNRHSSEFEPFMTTLGLLRAPDGVWSIMGNHDYGDYYHWAADSLKRADISRLQALQDSIGWRMLNNAHAWLRRHNDSIAIIGVENIGDPPFTVYGDLKKAYPDLGDPATKILLSHNPAHWCDSVAGHADRNIALTLSGHTHAMQIELFGLSPAALRYKTWGGLYDDEAGHKLYVNIGLGEVGFPARIGATPEITLITLKKK